MKIDVIIPALNEELALTSLLEEMPWDLVRKVLVVDNGSTDRTAEVASLGGALVVSEPRHGYGRAVWRGIEYLMDDPPGAVAFMAGDRADDPTEISLLISEMTHQAADMVVGSRKLGHVHKGSMPLVQRVGNDLISFLLQQLIGIKATDLGSFRLVQWPALLKMNLVDRGMGITVEMLIKCARLNLKVTEVPTTNRIRMGEQKISGTIGGSSRAAAKILWMIAKHRFLISQTRDHL